MFKSVKKAKSLNEGNSIISRLYSVITGRVPVILVQRVTNLVNKLAVLLKRSMLRQDSRDKPENDGCWSRGCSVFNASALSVILEREHSELSRGSRNIKAILFNEADSVFSRLSSVITGFIPVILVQRVTNLVNTLAIFMNRMYHPGSSANELTLKAKDDESGCLLRCWKRVFSACCQFFKYPSLEANASTSPAGGEVLNSALILTAFMLFSAAAQATVCFLPDGNCGGVNYGYKDDSGSNCTYRTRDEANNKKGECEEVNKQGFCYYLSCSMSKKDCDAKAAEDSKCCVPCGNCWKVADCVNPPIETCTGAGYETEQTCKSNNQDFEPNGKFDKSGTACGTCKDVPYITCPEMGDDYITRAECTAKGGSFTFNYAEVKDSDNNECGTCEEEPAEQSTCNQLGYKTSCSYIEKAIDVGVKGSDGQCVRCAECKTRIHNIMAEYASYASPKYRYNAYEALTNNASLTLNCEVNSQKNGITGTYFGSPYFVVYKRTAQNGQVLSNGRSNWERNSYLDDDGWHMLEPVTKCILHTFGEIETFDSDEDYMDNFCAKTSLKIYIMLPNADIEMVKVMGIPAGECSADDFIMAANPYAANGNLANYDQHVFTSSGGEQVLSPLYVLDGYLKKPDYLTSEKFTKTMVDFSEIKSTDYEYCWSGSNLDGKRFVMVEIPVTLRRGLDYLLEVVLKLDDIQCKNGQYGTDYRGWADHIFYEFSGKDYYTITRKQWYDYPRIHLPEIDDLDAANNYEPGVYYPTLKPDEACSL